MAFNFDLALAALWIIALACLHFYFARDKRLYIEAAARAHEKLLEEAVAAAKKAPALSLSAEDLLHDLTRGPAVLRVEVIDAKNLFLRSPRS